MGSVTGASVGVVVSAGVPALGVSEGSIREFECELDREDGIMVYEIDFECGNYEYEYEINAATGEIVKYDIEEE